MSDTPDFDSMTPEEMMKWMESLAVRQGATEGMTTDADMEVAEVDESDTRLEGMGEYKPYGMSDAEWEKLQAKDEAEKQSRLQAQPAPPQAAPPPPPEPEPMPEPEPVAAEPAAAEGDMPDFDSMSPEEMMEWMESLAKRQGATEGMTTNADMQIAEVDESDTRLEGMGEYKPFGMSDDEWEKLQAKDEAEKQARLQAPTPEPEIAMADLSDLGLEEPEIAMADLNALGLGEIDEEETEPMPAGFNFDALGLDDVEDTAPVEPIAEQSPMDWLSNLAGEEAEVGGLDFDMDALGELEGLGEAESAGDPMDWLAGLAADDGADALTGLTEMTGDSEGSLEWMESLAREQGADSEELVTAADLDIPRPEGMAADGPGYEEFSFEEGTGLVQDTDQTEAIVPQAAQEAPEFNLEDPESWLEDLASGGVIEEEDDEISVSSENWILEDDESVEQLDYDSVSDDVTSKLSSGTADAEDIEAFFTAAFQQAAKRTDVPDYIDEEDEAEVEVAAPVQAEIPDWLQESMEAQPIEEDTPEPELSEPAKTSTAEMMAATLFGDDDEGIEPAEIPDWLQGEIGEDTGDISADIFADEVLEEAAEHDAAVEAIQASATDTSDTWVQAFSDGESGELSDWYDSAVAQLGNEGADVAAASIPAAGLQAADLPLESNLPEGTPQDVPAWLGSQTTDSTRDSIEMESVDSGDMDWLGTDEADSIEEDMPDWLKETVDDTVAADEDIPTWLQGDAAEIAQDEIPSWLRETMDEGEEVEVMPDFLEENAAVAAVFSEAPPAPAPPVPQSPAPVPVPVANIDVAETMKSAQEKVAAGDIDGGLLDYEQVVRANAALEQVEKAVQKLATNDKTKKHPAVYRVLGDVLMRQGKLQQALDTYRKALNLL